MTDRDSKPTTRRGEIAIGFAAGLISGVLIILALGGGRDIREEQAAPEKPVDSTPVTLANADGSNGGAAGDTLARLLESDGASDLDRTREMLDFVDGVKPDDIEAQLDMLFATRKGRQGYNLSRYLYSKWVESDPASAVRHAENLEGRNRSDSLDAVLFAWSAKEPYEVIAWVEGKGKTPESREALGLALREIAKDDPKAAIALAERSGSGSTPEIRATSLLSTWAEKDPQAAAAFALSNQNSLDRHQGLRSVASQWATSDPQAAWDWGSALERTKDREDVLQMIVGVVVTEGDTDQAIAFLETIPPGQVREQALEQIASNLAIQDPEGAFELVRNHSRTSDEIDPYNSVFHQWAQRDPHKAFQTAVLQLPPGSPRNMAIQYSLNEVAKSDPARTLKMLDQLDEQAKEEAISSISRTLAISDRDLAVKLAEGLPNGDQKESILSTILDEWVRVEPLQAVAYGSKIENDSLRRRSLGSALDQWGRNDAVAAMTWAVKNLVAKDQEDLVPRLLGNWVKEDAAEAADWVSALPDGDLRDGSVSSLVSSWASRDLAAAGEWLRQIPKGKGRDSAVSNYASHVYDTDPEAALVWADSIGNESTRFSQVELLARRYLRHEPEKAKRWIANSSLPAERKEELLKSTN